jgi:glycopeptide antibiotics resistance protein
MSRRLVLCAGVVLFVAMAAYGSFVPFRLRDVTFSDAMQQFSRLRLGARWSPSHSDFVANVLLFVPIGFTLTGTLADGSRKLAWAAVPVVAMASCSIALAIEFGQMFVVGRTSSWNDVLAEGCGGLAGAVAWALVRSPTLGWLGSLIAPATAVERARSLLSVYAFVWLVLQVLPLDFTLRPAELGEKYRAGRIVLAPFSHSTGVVGALSNCVGVAIPALPIGALALVALPGRRRGFAAAALLGTAVVCAAEGLQVFVISRYATASDAICGSAGSACGAWLAHRWFGRRSGGDQVSAQSRGLRPWGLAALTGWLVVLMVRHWRPFDFAITAAMFHTRFSQLYAIPFSSYYRSNYLDALSEVIAKILLGVPVGVLLHVCWPAPVRRTLQWLRVGIILVIAIGVFSLIEVGQVFLPSRYPDDTDIVLGTFGAVAGLLGVWLIDRARIL